MPGLGWWQWGDRKREGRGASDVGFGTGFARGSHKQLTGARTHMGTMLGGFTGERREERSPVESGIEWVSDALGL